MQRLKFKSNKKKNMLAYGRDGEHGRGEDGMIGGIHGLLYLGHRNIFVYLFGDVVDGLVKLDMYFAFLNYFLCIFIVGLFII